MPRSFDLAWGGGATGERGPQFSLRLAALVLAVLNLAAVYLLIYPPGGTRSELLGQGEQLRSDLQTARAHAAQLQSVSRRVVLGSEQSSSFEKKYILPRRTAYERLATELQRITRVSGVKEGDATYTEEPIEGTADLTLLTSSANYQGSYGNMRRFLLELDHSPVLIMLDTLSASPQQKGAEINTSMRFQTIMQEEAGASIPMPSVGAP